MGFDQYTADRPLIEPRKRSTQVNIWIAIGVVVFLLLGAIATIWFWRRGG